MQKEFHSYFHWCLRNCFSKVTEKFDRNIAKRAIILHKNIFSKIWKMFLYIHIRKVCFAVIGNNLFSNEVKSNNAQTRYIDTWLYRYWFCLKKTTIFWLKKRYRIELYLLISPITSSIYCGSLDNIMGRLGGITFVLY